MVCGEIGSCLRHDAVYLSQGAIPHQTEHLNPLIGLFVAGNVYIDILKRKVRGISKHFLKIVPVVHHKAIYSRELERLFSLDGRTLRRKISSLRQDGFPICSDETGYYYAETQKEINDTVCRLNSLVLRISNARTGMLYASVMSDDPVMVNININLE